MNDVESKSLVRQVYSASVMVETAIAVAHATKVNVRMDSTVQGSKEVAISVQERAIALRLTSVSLVKKRAADAPKDFFASMTLSMSARLQESRSHIVLAIVMRAVHRGIGVQSSPDLEMLAKERRPLENASSVMNVGSIQRGLLRTPRVEKGSVV